MLNDSDLRQAVQDGLEWEPGVTAAHIGVTAASGVVTLSGYVESYAARVAAEAAAGRVKGVKAVAEEIKVRLPNDVTTSDDEIAAAAVQRLAWNVVIPTSTVRVKVENGWVTLTGQVSEWFQRNAAEQDIRPLKGVVGVTDRIIIKSVVVDTAYLSDNITHALHRSWFFDPKQVQVTATGGTIRLMGSVRTYSERCLAETTAWAAPGVTSVQNDIAVIGE